MEMEEIRQLELKAVKNDIAAITELSETYMYDTPVNKGRAVELFRKGADLNDPYLTWCLADAFYYGEGVRKSIQDAIKYYEVAAFLGQPEAMTALGMYYIEDVTGSPNYKKAISYYKQAADLEEPNAIHNLGICYSNGNGVIKNVTKAFKLFLLAATLGHEEAQFKVGWCFINSEGVRENREEARVWLLKAAKSGHHEAQKLFQELNT